QLISVCLHDALPISTLLEEGILEQNSGDGKYHLGLALFELGAMVRRKMDFTMEARPFLRTLMEKTGETVHLAILDRDSILYIIRSEEHMSELQSRVE